MKFFKKGQMIEKAYEGGYRAKGRIQIGLSKWGFVRDFLETAKAEGLKITYSESFGILCKRFTIEGHQADVVSVYQRIKALG